MKLLLSSLFLMFTFSAFAQNQIDGFQKAKFGYSFEKVKEHFPKLESHEKKGSISTALLSNSKLIGKEAALLFSFYEDKLYSVMVMFFNESSANNADINEYSRIKKLLIKSYGNPSKFSERTHTVGSRDFTYMQIKSGDLFWYSDWDDSKNKSKIRLTITGRNFKSSVGLSYTDEKLDKLATEYTEKSNASEL